MFSHPICQYLMLLLPILPACRHQSKPGRPVELSPPQIVDPANPQSKPDPASPPIGEVLPLDGMRWKSFSAYDVTERCLALEEFSGTFVRQYGDNATIKDWTCRKDLLLRDLRIYADFRMEHGQKQTKLRYWLEINGSEATLQFSVNSTSYGGTNFSPELAAISPKLGHWEATLTDFLKNPNAEQKIFGRPYSEFIDAVIMDLKSQGLSMKAKDGSSHVVKVSLKPGDNRASGTVSFQDVPAPLLNQAADATETTPGTISIGRPAGVLGCSDLACLNDGSVGYLIADEHFSLWRDIPASGSAIRQTAFAGATFTSFPEPPRP